MRFLTLQLLLSLLVPALPAHTAAQPKSFTDPVVLLKAVAKQYAANTVTFRIEYVEEWSQNSDLEHDWRKTCLTAIKGPGNLFRLEVRGPSGTWIQDSDGTDEWLYLADANVYTEVAVSPGGPHFPKVELHGEMDLTTAWDMSTWLESVAAQYQHAEMLPPQTIVLDGHSYDCYVVHVTNQDSSRNSDKDVSWDDTFWIDRTELVFRKQIEHVNGYSILSTRVHLPEHYDTTTVYPVVEFSPQLSPEIFRFTPPAGAKKIASLQPEISAPPPPHPVSMIGKLAPDITLTEANGETVPLSSYHGKPVLLDLWATWCGPCLVSMPALNRIYREVKPLGVVVLTVDRDNTAANATAWLARNHYTWTNFHDPHGLVGKAFQESGIPLTVLIDAQGKIVYDNFGADEAALRKAIAALGPQYASLAATIAPSASSAN